MKMGSLSIQSNTDDFARNGENRYLDLQSKRPDFFPCTACGRFFTNRAMLVHKRTCLETVDCQCSACKSDSKRSKLESLMNLKSFESLPFETNNQRRDPEKRQIKVTPRMQELIMNRVKYNNVDQNKLLTFKLLEENNIVIDKMVGRNGSILHPCESEKNHDRKSESPPVKTSENSDLQAAESFCEVKMKIDHECDRKLFCSICDSHFHWELFGSHIIQHCEIKLPNSLKCPSTDCHRSFQQPALFLSHYLIHYGDHPINCNDCKCSDAACAELNYEKKKNYYADAESHPCYICLASFNHPQTVINHMRLHSKERPFKCTECNRSFRQVGNLQRHITTHRGDRPYNCPECDKSFADPATLRNHERVHTKETPYKCVVCHRSFTQVGNLKRHLTLHMKKQQSSISLSSSVRSNSSETDSSKTNGQNSVDNSNGDSDYIINDVSTLCEMSSKNHKKGKMKVFTCKICKKVYAWKHDLVVHFRTHTGEKPYKCDECGKKFAQSGAVRIHKARHHAGLSEDSSKQKS